jgi:uncharacterized protein YjaG (DUF416 family)
MFDMFRSTVGSTLDRSPVPLGWGVADGAEVEGFADGFAPGLAGGGALHLDQARVAERIGRLPARSRTALAAASAERLAAAYEAFADPARGDDVQLVVGALRSVWAHLESGAPVVVDTSRLEQEIPGLDDAWREGTDLVESAVTCVAYAVRAATTGHPDAAAWAVVALSEAADTAAQLTVAAEGRSSARVEATIEATPAAQAVITGIRADLIAVEDGSMTTADLRARAHDAGRAWRESFLP